MHAGFSYDDWNHMERAFALDRTATGVMLDALAGTHKAFIYISGSGVFSETGQAPFDESICPNATGAVAIRADLERVVLNSNVRRIRSMVIRPGLVYGHGGSGVLHFLFNLTREAGGPRTVGAGDNVWSAIHVDDLARLYVGAVERGLPATLFNAANDDVLSMRDIAIAAADVMGLTGTPSIWPLDQARDAIGLLADGLASNKRISSCMAREQLGWIYGSPGLLSEIRRGSYAAFRARLPPA